MRHQGQSRRAEWDVVVLWTWGNVVESMGVDHWNTRRPAEETLLCPKNGLLFRMTYGSWNGGVIWVSSGRKSSHQMSLEDKTRQMSTNAQVSLASQFLLWRLLGAHMGEHCSLMPTGPLKTELEKPVKCWLLLRFMYLFPKRRKIK